MKDTIDLSKLTSQRIDLDSGFTSRIFVRGVWKGGRISVYGASGKDLVFENGKIETTHTEDALVIADAAVDLTIGFADFDLVFGALTFWKGCQRLTVNDARILYAHTGIRYTNTEPSDGILIDGAYILAPRHEGIYWGASKAHDAKHTNVKIVRCIVKDAGWDGFQLGNTNGIVSDCTVDGYGLRREQWQDKGININPGSIVSIDGCRIFGGTGQQYVGLDSRVFISNPK